MRRTKKSNRLSRTFHDILHPHCRGNGLETRWPFWLVSKFLARSLQLVLKRTETKETASIQTIHWLVTRYCAIFFHGTDYSNVPATICTMTHLQKLQNSSDSILPFLLASKPIISSFAFSPSSFLPLRKCSGTESCTA